MMPKLEWRPMRPEDLDEVLRIAAVAHPTLPERLEVFAEKLRLYPAGCKSLAPASASASAGKGISGYFFSHPWYADEIPALDCLLEGIPALTDTYYLHDLALAPEARGAQHGSEIARFTDLHARTKGYARQALVAVNASEQYWRRQGFEWVQRPNLDEKLQAYGNGARLMIRLTGI